MDETTPETFTISWLLAQCGKDSDLDSAADLSFALGTSPLDPKDASIDARICPRIKGAAVCTRDRLRSFAPHKTVFTRPTRAFSNVRKLNEPNRYVCRLDVELQ